MPEDSFVSLYLPNRSQTDHFLCLLLIFQLLLQLDFVPGVIVTSCRFVSITLLKAPLEWSIRKSFLRISPKSLRKSYLNLNSY